MSAHDNLQTKHTPPAALDPGHSYAKTHHISFALYPQISSPMPVTYTYFLSLPPSYPSTSNSRGFPLLLFLHGAGESQQAPNTSYATLRHGVPKMILAYDLLRQREEAGEAPGELVVDIPPPGQRKSKDSAVVPVNPECARIVAEKFITVSPSLDMRKDGYGWKRPALVALVEEVCGMYHIDRSRIYVTGISMGGYGTWDLALGLAAGEKSTNGVGVDKKVELAAIVPICGGADEIRAAALLKNLPVWNWHGDHDTIIPVSESERVVEAMKKAGAQECWFTVLKGVGHDGAWTEAYNRKEVWEWLLEHEGESGGKDGEVGGKV